MITCSSKFCVIQHLLRDRAGNFGILTALAIPVLAAAAGVAVDVSNMAVSDSQLQEATDAAALATATALANGSATTSNAQQLATDFVTGQMSNYLSGDTSAISALKAGTTATVTKTTDSSGNASYSVVVNASYAMQVNGMTRMLGLTTMNVGASSTSVSGNDPAQTQKSPLSMYFVLDRSGSMDEPTDTVNAQQPTTTVSCGNNNKKTCTVTNYYTKIQSLKIATANLAAQLNTADPNSMYVRTGADSYNSNAQTPTALAWGTSRVTQYVNNLTASGTTNSAPAFTAAVTALTMASTTPGLTNEQLQHKNKNGQTNPATYIVFMTDGDNNVASADTNTKAQCDIARNAGIHVYTIAFMAPANGQALLKYCATSAADYFTPQNAADLFSAFSSIATQASKKMTLLTK
ncbi:vWA domain-containing protein [Rhizobium leucaenae]|uniref:Flp pilus assembly protein TadG n=1 Tax=Rhizobium leucaenae TaxID=29450 RepID=A0A7W7EI90_9HYPH|nr:vWA domain-containing protein [Rhizobium leucaenae]MBB4566520.1 Flp pilus assembly protein TadG [Rhizobium leucaenae]MBB6301586.1 Flp pilus assembly protein TadG [Rhizobium leucaenae]